MVRVFIADSLTEFLTADPSTTCIVVDALSGCYSLRYLALGGDCSVFLNSLTNLETLVITNLKSENVFTLFGGQSNVPITLKNIVLKKGCYIRSKDAFKYISGVRIFIEDEKNAVQYDRDYPGWNNDNKVYYGGEWVEIAFKAPDGTVLSDEIYTTSQIIRQPILADAVNGEWTDVFVGWDTDGDGVADPIPAISATSFTATALVETVATELTVRFIDDSGEILSSAVYGYGEEIVLPQEPSRKGYLFLGWRGYVEHMAATANVDFFAEWQHVGDGHHYVHTVVEPTCEGEGCDLYTCSDCDHSYWENVVPALGHSFGDWTIQTAATCTEEGLHYRICSVCGKREEEPVPAHGHNYVATVLRAATCKQEGLIRYTCSHCGDQKNVTTPKTGHQYEKVKTNKTFLQWLIEHLLNIFFGYEGNQGYYYKCSDCGHILTSNESFGPKAASIMDVHEHTPGEWVIAKEPTCEEEGIYGRYCTDCGELIEAEVLPKAILYGDVNGDGSIDGKDLIVLRRYLVGADVEIFAGADVNGDGEIDGKDVIILRKYLVGTAQLGPTA